MDSADALPEGQTGRVVPVSQLGKFPRLRANLAKFAVLLPYLLHPWETHGEWVEWRCPHRRFDLAKP